MKLFPFLLIITPLLWSCATPPADAETSGESQESTTAQTGTSGESPEPTAAGTESESEDEYPTRQDELGFLYVDLSDETVPTRDFQTYSIVFALNAVLSHTGLNGVLEPRHKLALARHLFFDYPAGYEGIYRETAVPEYFRNDDPLIFRQRALQPGADAEVSADGILLIHTNLFIDPETGAIDPAAGRFGTLQQNIAFIFLIAPDGRLISTRYMKSAAAAPQLPAAGDLDADTPPEDILAAVETILHTGQESELEGVPALLDSLQERDELDPMQRAMAGLNRFLYLLRTDRDTDAAAVLDELREDSELNADPEIMRVIESEAAAMLSVYRELQAR